MTQKSIVTFKDPDQNQIITINFSYDPETKALDYNVDVVPELKQGDPIPEGINFFLANTFMKTLEASDESQKDNENESAEKED